MKRHLALAAAVVVVALTGGAGPCDVILGNAECATDQDCHGTRLCTDAGKCVECKSDHDCDRTEVCGADGTCERASLAEGEGDVGEGEGSAHVGEGEGSAHGGEGEGSAHGGEGEGSPGSCVDACDCNPGDACVGGTCGAPAATFCTSNADCPRTSSSSCVLEVCDGLFCQVPSAGEGEGEGSAGGEGEGEGSCDPNLEFTCILQGENFDPTTCQCVPASGGGEGEGEGSAADVCTNHIGKGTQDGCDCGCGQVDPDCGTGGCSTPGCGRSSLGCGFCWDGNTQALSACPQ